MRTKFLILLIGMLIVNFRLHGQKHYIATGTDTITCEVLGASDTTLLFIHGWGIDKNVWKYQTSYFQSCYKIVYYDLAGFGSSTKNSSVYTIAQYSADLGEVIRKLNLKNVILIAHSMAANMAIQLLSSNPKEIIGIVGVDVFKNLQKEIPDEIKQEETFFLSLLESNFKKYSDLYARQYLLNKSSNRESKSYVKKAFKRMNPQVGLQTLSSAFTVANKETYYLEQITLPIYLVNSKEVPTDTIALKEHCKMGIELIEIEKTGHFPMLESPKEFNTALNGHLNSIHRNK